MTYQTQRDNMELACSMVQQLFRAFGGQGFARERLPLGLQSIQQLDWAMPNEEMTAFRKRRQQRRKERFFHKVHRDIPFVMDLPTAGEYMCAGNDDQDIVLIDQGMAAARLVKYRIHSFDTDARQDSDRSWQVFVKTDHADFVWGSLSDNECPLVRCASQPKRQVLS